MKILLFVLFLVPIFAVAQSGKESQQAPIPVPAVVSPVRGMQWTISIRTDPDPAAPAIVIQGVSGKQYRSDSVRYLDGATQQWFTMEDGICLWRSQDNRLVKVGFRDQTPDAAYSFYVRGFPGLSTITSRTPVELRFDRKSQRWLAVRTSEPMPYRQAAAGEAQAAMPTGSIVKVVAVFDALTGLPVSAEVGDKFYTFDVSRGEVTDPVLPEGLTSALRSQSQRQAALHEALQQNAKP